MLLLSSNVISQPLSGSTLKKKRIAANQNTSLDTLSIVPGSYFIKDVDTSYYFIDAVNATIFWKKKISSDSVTISYRTFYSKLNSVVQRYAYDSIVHNFIAVKKKGLNKENSFAPLFDFGNMNYNGSFGRALSFGNSQDVVVNSQFNLQLSGMLADSIEVAAAITDNNIPIQPDGTTQQLNEFDRIWLQFKKKTWDVNLGDIDLRQNNLYFLNFYKRLQGVAYSNISSIGNQGVNKLQLSGAIAKGKFTRNIFQGAEGNQGPYRLRGVSNELFFIVLAGSERIFIDGLQMQRGEDQDYIINYNTAEVTFTQRRMITKDSRIQIEFEYAERSYLNSMLYVADELQVNKKLKLNIAAYTNSDAKNSTINQSLNDKQRQFLNNLGDSIQNAYYPSVFEDSFSVSKILYAQKDTLVSGNSYAIYVYSTNPDSARYNLSFIETGVGKGNYITDFNGANGKVYKWIAPVNGIAQGSFEPAIFLVTPKKLQLVTIGAAYDFTPQTSFLAEVARSNYDVNTFSVKNKNDNTGFAGRFLLSHAITIQQSDKTKQVKMTAGYETAEKYFKPLERLRTVEFYRDWGLDYIPPIANEHLPLLSVELSDSLGNLLKAQSSAYIRSDGYKGYRQQFIQRQKIQSWYFNNEVNYTSFNSANTKGYFLRPNLEAGKMFSALQNVTVGAAFALQENVVKYLANDSLSAAAFSFNTLSAFVKSDITKENTWVINYFTRSDKLPLQNNLQQVDRSHNLNIALELLKNKKHQFRLNTTYRQLEVYNTTLTNLTPDKTILGRVEYIIHEYAGLINGSVLYEAGSGQEQRRDFSYLEVPAGRGEYTWNDYNADGVPQLNEFEIALFPDQAKYIRIFTPTNQYVKSNYTQFNYSLAISPRMVKLKNSKVSRIVTKFDFQSSLQSAKKEISDGFISVNPFKKNISDTSLISFSNIIANTLSFNRYSTKWGIDISNVRNSNKVLLTYGFESRKLNNWIFKSRFNIDRTFTLELIQRTGYQSLITPGFSNRNYFISNMSTEPRLTFTKGTIFRFQAGYQFMQKRNDVEYGGEKSSLHSYTLESKFNAVNNISLSAKIALNTIDYNGNVNSTVSYIILDALLPGKNTLWNVELTKRLGNNLELSFQYDGRKPAETRTIHIGRASIRAIL